ncbi:MAG TPA: hypothetical protein PK675_03880 [Clostridia bacterium]|nr:hypothetical protein [Clostridia bacterium]
MSKSVIKKILVYIGFFVLLLLLRKSPFPVSLSFGLYVGFLYCLNPYISTLVFCLSALPFDVSSIFVALSQGAVMLLVAIIYTALKRKINKGLLIFYVLLAQVFYIIYGLDGPDMLFSRLINCGSIDFFVCFSLCGTGVARTWVEIPSWR